MPDLYNAPYEYPSFMNINHDNKPDRFPGKTGERVFIAFAILVVVLIISGCCINCIACCKRRRQQMQSDACYNSPVVVTSATHTAPGGYPVTQIPATTYQPHAYGTAYPAQNTGNVSVQMPMPMHMPGAQPPMPGMSPHVAAYPPMPQPGVAAANMNPPSYDMAMANPGPSVMPGGYEKQMPYNPNYAQ
ncbi:tyrosine-protein phosphatase non-receptor type 23 isoform X1 [Drosophila novamexicana]|uniref:tyrosine-protein phosphatase non-receptor type 23 isoform X1 n=1 Tax=Drosophila novamexicana TaxID=47314 RepID=UPI0011E60415|nr:tyrosine-protein phosphatase non-receptor type 23 isoform X1 [Drosophila novamexicana]